MLKTLCVNVLTTGLTIIPTRAHTGVVFWYNCPIIYTNRSHTIRHCEIKSLLINQSVNISEQQLVCE